MKPLTKSQQKVYDYIKDCLAESRIPSVREICNATGLKSTSTVHLHLKTLEERGLIERDHGMNRCIRLPGAEKTASVPVMGRVTAGMPILAVEDVEGYVTVSETFRRGRELFALRVVGESMINAGILDGDTVIVHRTPTAENGEIVVALVGEEATVKRFYKEKGHFRLQPENDSFEPIIVDEVVLLGKVIALFRNFDI
ncbi:MAG: transcriptional repressor LexA [Oscillospiraceae bacterium]|nr:transcriptional repressor LexA [Oscillospiraceae bacterium]